MLKRTGALLLAIIGLTACTEERHIAVVGVGEVIASPSSAIISVTIVGFGDTRPEATEELVNRVDEVVRRATALGVADDDIGESYFDISERFETERLANGVTLRNPIGFEAEQWLVITVNDIDAVSAVLSNVVAIGGIEASQPSYRFDDTDALFAQARETAMEDARRRAAQYAEGVGLSLGEALIIEESGTAAQRLDFDLRDKLSRRSQVQRDTFDRIVSLDVVSPDDSLDVGLIDESQVIRSTPDDVSVTISIYAKFAVQ